MVVVVVSEYKTLAVAPMYLLSDFYDIFGNAENFVRFLRNSRVTVALIWITTKFSAPRRDETIKRAETEDT